MKRLEYGELRDLYRRTSELRNTLAALNRALSAIDSGVAEMSLAFKGGGEFVQVRMSETARAAYDSRDIAIPLSQGAIADILRRDISDQVRDLSRTLDEALPRIVDEETNE